MKKYLLTLAILFAATIVFAQPGKKPVQKPPAQSEMDKAMEEAMKGMSEEEKAEMKKMMGNVMPALMEQNSKMADYPEFTSNKQLVPKKDIVRINAIPKKKLSQAEIGSYAANLYNKLMTKGDAAEIAIVKKVIAQSPKANDLGGAAILCMMQGHPQAAMALSMKAVQTDISNPNWQNNMASLLTQYGYPEQAVPVLQKLRNDFADNSTVMNNLAHAWLGLGEIDSAKAMIRKAGGLNPYHPETKETEGVIEETNGNPVKAGEDYEESQDNSINPFTEQLIKNNKGQVKSDNIDFEKIKHSITIYEYFPKDWIKIPELSNSVSGYENDMRIINGYEKMFEELETKIDQLKDAAEQEINTLADKGEEGFAKEMMQESLKGLSMMSKPAITVQKILQIYLADWQMDYVKGHAEFIEMINNKRKEMTKSGNNDKCPDWDRRNNEFLAYANPLIREYHTKKIEEFRSWLNAFCTWVWYIAGNPKNMVIVQCVSWTAGIEQFYKEAIHDLNVEFPSCVKHNGDGIATIAAPEIPNFTCPTIVGMPMGTEWEQLGKTTNNFDENKYGIKKAAANPVPNHTIAYGADHTSIAEPGPDPFFKSANGSMTPGISDPELSAGAQLIEILKKYNERRSIDFKLGISSPDGAAEFVAGDIRRVLDEARQRDAREQAQGDGLRELMKKKIESQKAAEEKQTNWFKEFIKSKIAYSKTEEYKRDIERATAEKIKKLQKSKLAHELLKKMMSTDCKNLKTTKEIQKELFEKGMREAGDNMEDLRSNGLQPSLSSGLQAPGTFTPVKGLFN